MLTEGIPTRTLSSLDTRSPLAPQTLEKGRLSKGERPSTRVLPLPRSRTLESSTSTTYLRLETDDKSYEFRAPSAVDVDDWLAALLAHGVELGIDSPSASRPGTFDKSGNGSSPRGASKTGKKRVGFADRVTTRPDEGDESTFVLPVLSCSCTATSTRSRRSRLEMRRRRAESREDRSFPPRCGERSELERSEPEGELRRASDELLAARSSQRVLALEKAELADALGICQRDLPQGRRGGVWAEPREVPKVFITACRQTL